MTTKTTPAPKAESYTFKPLQVLAAEMTAALANVAPPASRMRECAAGFAALRADFAEKPTAFDSLVVEFADGAKEAWETLRKDNASISALSLVNYINQGKYAALAFLTGAPSTNKDGTPRGLNAMADEGKAIYKAAGFSLSSNRAKGAKTDTAEAEAKAKDDAETAKEITRLAALVETPAPNFGAFLKDAVLPLCEYSKKSTRADLARALDEIRAQSSTMLEVLSK